MPLTFEFQGDPGVAYSGLLGNLLSARGLCRGNDLGLQDVRHLFVVRVLHVVGASSARRRRQVLFVRQHFGHRHLGANDGHRTARIHAPQCGRAGC